MQDHNTTSGKRNCSAMENEAVMPTVGQSTSLENIGATSDSFGDTNNMPSEPFKKRKKIDPQQQMQILYEFVRKYKREDGTELCEAFIRAPKKRTDPNYYESVSCPMDFVRVQQRLKMEEYNEFNDLCADLHLIVNNAKLYYSPEDKEYRDAVELGDLITKAVARVETCKEMPAVSISVPPSPNIAGSDSMSTSMSDSDGYDNTQVTGNNDSRELLEELFSSIITAVDPLDSSRPLHLAFRLLPSQKRYPEYYRFIDDPMDLKMIATKLTSNQYANLLSMEEDIALLVKNATSFNEPGSKIFKDAKLLLKIAKSKRLELESFKKARGNRGLRATRRLAVKTHYSAEIAALQYEDSETDDDSSEEPDFSENEDPLWQLYNHVRFYRTVNGLCLAEPFITLPSKRELPDYYKKITDPISLSQVRKKLKNGEYTQLVDLADDLNTMFENCKAYNRPDSRLYKEGVKLLKIMNAKLEELEEASDVDLDAGDDQDIEDDTEEDDELMMPAASSIKKRMRNLYNAVLHYRAKDGSHPIAAFMTKPNKKDYPYYYEVISNPMDMQTINDRIKNNFYKDEFEFMSDMKAMFSNCRKFNEEASQIYRDANTLERVLLTKARESNDGYVVSHLSSPKMSNSLDVNSKNATGENELSVNIKRLFETVRDYKDAKGRQLSLIFLKLPNPREFPHYYEVIKSPIDFEKISSKIKSKSAPYTSLNEVLNDFVLMFDNACKFNEPDSQIYKDALNLQNLARKTVINIQDMSQCGAEGGGFPDISLAVNELINSIFVAIYNYQDAEERCFSDSLAELPEYDEVYQDGKLLSRVRPLSLDLIKRRLDQRLYKRLDVFQRDIFSVFERARNLSRSDAQIFEDSLELQSYFIRIRDELCGNGDILQSRALLYTQVDLEKSVIELRSEKQIVEQTDDKNLAAIAAAVANASGSDSNMFMPDDDPSSSNTDSFTSNVTNQQYFVGDFVYVDIKDMKGLLEPQIFLIEKIFQPKITSVDGGGNGESVKIYGNQFYRPVETFHVSSRKFLENEVFRTEIHGNINVKDIVGKCWVMPVKDFFRSRPEGFNDKDVFVCESRYSTCLKSFKKMKVFWPVPSHVNIVARSEPLKCQRVMSVFKERIEKHKEEIEELEKLEKTVEDDLKPNVIMTKPELGAGGDSSYVMNVFYEQYTIPGPITLRRGDSVYVRSENGKNLIAQIDTMWVSPDGIAYFNGPWFVTPKEMPPNTTNPQRNFYVQEACLSTISDTNPLLSVVGKACILEFTDFIKSRPTSYAEDDVYVCESMYDESKRVIRGPLHMGLKQYEHSPAVYADEVYFFKKPILPVKDTTSSGLIQNASNSTLNTTGFVGGNISGAIEPNEDSLDDSTVACLADGDYQPSTPNSSKKNSKTCYKKLVTPFILFSSEIRKQTMTSNKGVPFGEISRIIGDKWRQTPESVKLIYAEKAKRINEANSQKTAEEFKLENIDFERKRNEVVNLSSKLSATPVVQQKMASSPVQQQSGPGLKLSSKVGTDPLFHTVPPRPQRLLHSEAYIRYIEGLTIDSNSICNWHRDLNANKLNTKAVIEESKLPFHWLYESTGGSTVSGSKSATSLDALWAMREFLMYDTLGLTRVGKQ